MAVQTKLIAAQKPTTVGNIQVTHTIGFEAKGMFCFGTYNTAAINTFTGHNKLTYGFSDMTNHYSIGSYDEDNVGTGDTMFAATDQHCLVFLENLASGVPVETGRMKWISRTSTQITVQFDNNDADASWYFLWVFGGDDITNVKVGNKTIPANQALSSTISYNDTGVSNPSVGFFLSSNAASAAETTNEDQTMITFGAAVSSVKQFLTTFQVEGSQAISDTRRRCSGGDILLSFSDTGAINMKAEFSAWITGGFTIGISTAVDAAAKNFGYMLVEGGIWDVDDFTTSASTGVVSQAVSTQGQTPKGLVLTTYGNAASTSILTEAHSSIGASDGTSQAVLAAHSKTAETTMINCEIHDTAKIIKKVTAVATEASSTTQLDAAFSSFAANAFSLNYAVAAAYIAGYIVVADNLASAGPVATTVTSKTVTNKFINKVV